MIKRKDCCCTSWKDIVKELWEKYQGVVKKITFNGRDYYPDGEGDVNIDLIVKGAISLKDKGTYWTLTLVDSQNATLTDKGTYWELEVI